MITRISLGYHPVFASLFFVNNYLYIYILKITIPTLRVMRVFYMGEWFEEWC
jgi:hypothetical protein